MAASNEAIVFSGKLEEAWHIIQNALQSVVADDRQMSTYTTMPEREIVSIINDYKCSDTHPQHSGSCPGETIMLIAGGGWINRGNEWGWAANCPKIRCPL